jgi:hypothetical protein
MVTEINRFGGYPKICHNMLLEGHAIDAAEVSTPAEVAVESRRTGSASEEVRLGDSGKFERGGRDVRQMPNRRSELTPVPRPAS